MLPAASGAMPPVPHADMMELLFFAYRDFTADPDEMLAEIGYGRAHHRVLHFVNRNPGMRVTDLLDILKITKQSLGRVLKQLVDDGYIAQRPGHADRRERLLLATERGRTLALDLADGQARRIEEALAGLDAPAREHVRAFLTRMIDPGDRARVRPSGDGTP